ncbi:AAA family ATPase, partial [Bifidobacterium catenulatum]|uniref:AAA family ATPase n=2 Tax=Bifidobacterium catenulatum TaxID=1686 RepID=UPI003F8FE7E1
MDGLKTKTTVPYPSVAADGGQSLSQKPNQSITEGMAEHKPPERDLEEIMRQISRVNDPAYLPTVSMNDLYEQVYPGRPPVIDGLLYAGTYLFVGAPKVGKSFLMAQLAYHVSMGLSLWGYEVRQGTVLYLVYGQINVYGVTTKSERHKRSYWTRTADGNGIGGRKAP